MPQNNYKTQSEKYEFISGQHGGYYRHNFIDHAYLYNLYFPPEAIFTNFKDQIHDLVLNYPMAQDALAGLVGKIIDQPAERIVVGNGAAELIKIVSGHISGKLIVPVPSFNEYANAAPSGQVVEFPLEFPSFQLDVDKFAAEAFRVKADVAVVVTPNNPTSLLISKPELIRLAKKLETNNCILIIDESFLDFVENPDLISMEQEIEKHPNVTIFKSMSKAYGICGLRIGYMLTANSKFAEAVRAGVHIWNINGFAEEFLRLLPDYKQEFIASCKQVRTDRDSLYKKLCDIEGMTVFKPDANFIFCRLPDYAQSAPEITKKLFIEHNMYIKDCVGKTQPDSDRYLRIASRTEAENCKLVESLIDVMDLKNILSIKIMTNLEPQQPHQPTILSFVRDLPNICSLAGLLCAVIGIYYAILDNFPVAIIGVLWAVLFDWADGIIARQIKGRTDHHRAIGGQLDSLIDIVSFGVFPAIFLLSYGKFSPWFLPGAFLIVAVSAIRLSYFNVFGLIDDKTYMGLALDNNVLILAFVFLFESFINHTVFSIILYALLMVFTVFNLAPIRTPKFAGKWFYFLIVYTLALTVIYGCMLWSKCH